MNNLFVKLYDAAWKKFGEYQVVINRTESVVLSVLFTLILANPSRILRIKFKKPT